MAGSVTVDTGKPLTGAKVLAILVGTFGIVFAVNGYMAYNAAKTFRGETNAHAYETGVKFNNELAKAGAQAARGWKVDVSLADGARATFRDAQGQPLTGLVVSGVYAAPADTKRDQRFALAETSPGVYAGAGAPAGLWNLVLTARRGEAVLFESDSRLMIDVPALETLNPGNWRVSLTILGAQAHANVRDAQGRPVEGLTVGGLFAAPKEDRTRNRGFSAREVGPGDYVIDPTALRNGVWDLEIEAKRGEAAVFQSRNRIELR